MQEKLEITFKGKKYQSRPFNVENAIGVEKIKAMLSAGQWGGIYRSNTPLGDEALIMIEVQSTFITFFPELIEDLKPKDITSLGILDYKDFKNLYFNSVKEWIDSWIAIIKDTGEEDGKKSNQ